MSLSVRLAPLARFGVLLPALAWAVALAISAWVAATWYWRLAGPRPEQSTYTSQTDPAAAAREIASRHMFGEAPKAPAQVVEASRFQLLGVAANSGRSRGFAVIQVSGQTPQPVIQGEEVMPGVQLTKILPQSVELSVGGVPQTIRLADPSAGAVPPPPLPATASAPQPQPAPAPQPANAQPAQSPAAENPEN